MNCKFGNFNVSTNIMFDQSSDFLVNDYTETRVYFTDSSNFNGFVNLPKGVTNFYTCFLGCRNFNQPVTIPNGALNCSLMFFGDRRMSYSVDVPETVENCHGMFSAFGSTNAYDCYAQDEMFVPGNATDYTNMFAGSRRRVVVNGINTESMYNTWGMFSDTPVMIPNLNFSMYGAFSVTSTGYRNARIYIPYVPNINFLKGIISFGSFYQRYPLWPAYNFLDRNYWDDFSIAFICGTSTILAMADELKGNLFIDSPYNEDEYTSFYGADYNYLTVHAGVAIPSLVPSNGNYYPHVSATFFYKSMDWYPQPFNI